MGAVAVAAGTVAVAIAVTVAGECTDTGKSPGAADPGVAATSVEAVTASAPGADTGNYTKTSTGTTTGGGGVAVPVAVALAVKMRGERSILDKAACVANITTEFFLFLFTT